MKILGLSGSPNKNGNNDRILDNFLAVVHEKKFETGKILLSLLKVKPCTACGNCRQEKNAL